MVLLGAHILLEALWARALGRLDDYYIILRYSYFYLEFAKITLVDSMCAIDG